MDPDPKKVMTWIVVIVVPVVAAAFVAGLLQFIEPGVVVRGQQLITSQYDV